MRDWFLNNVKQQYQIDGDLMYSNNEKFITEQINNQDEYIIPVNINSIEKGGFYFILYNLDGKSTNMEKFNPLLVCDWFDLQGTRWLYGISLNFIPMNIRVLIFNEILNANYQVVHDNLSIDVTKQNSLNNIDFVNMHKLLFNVGFEWSIRKFDMRLINSVYKISTNILTQFITMSTIGFTGVDDFKLVEIWQKKINEQDVRQQKIIKELLNDYSEMKSNLNKTYSNLNDKNNSLQDALNIINNF